MPLLESSLETWAGVMEQTLHEKLLHYSNTYWVDTACVYLGVHEGVYYCFQTRFYHTREKDFQWKPLPLDAVPEKVYTAYCMAKLEGREL